MSLPDDGSYLSDAERSQVANFIGQVLERVFNLNADRVRFDADHEEVVVSFYNKRDLLTTSHIRSAAFEVIWGWLLYEGFVGIQRQDLASPTFLANITHGNGYVEFTVQRSRTLSQKKSLVLTQFIKSGGEKYPPDKRLHEIYEHKELEQWRKFGARETQVITRAMLTKNDQTTVLLVDGNDEHRKSIRQALERAKYKVREAVNGEDALTSIEESVPDIVITDIVMPKVDGNELLQRIRAEGGLKHLFVLVFSSTTDPSIELDMLNRGADDYCPKTVNPKVFLKRLENLARRQNEIKQAIQEE